MRRLLENYFQFIKKVIPSKPDQSSVGLDIGTSECKLAEIKKTNHSFELLNLAIEPVNKGDVKSAIQKCLSRLKKPCESVYTSVFGKGTLIRYIDMPRMSLNDLHNAFAIEADKYFPFVQDEVYIDCDILDPQEKASQMLVMAAAAKKDIVDQRIKLLADLGLSVDFVGMNPVALANAYQALDKSVEEQSNFSVALLDMGESVSSLMIMMNKTPKFHRDIYIGGRELTKRIASGLGLSFDEAEQLKRQPGSRLEEIVALCEPVITNIVEELKLSFDYFTSDIKNREFNKILLTGGASNFQGLVPVLEKSLELKVEHWDPLSFVDAPAAIKDEFKNKSLQLGVVIGLALY